MQQIDKVTGEGIFENREILTFRVMNHKLKFLIGVTGAVVVFQITIGNLPPRVF